MKNKIISTALILMFLVCLSSVASAWQLTTVGTGHNPATYGNLVAWSDGASGNGGNIHVYDLSAKKDTLINSSSASYPAIYGNTVVWRDSSNGVPMLTVYDLKSKSKSYVTQNVDSSSIPMICGNIITWSANDGVYMRDISKSTQTMIGTGTNPDIDGTKIAYTNDTGGAFADMFGLGIGSVINVYDTSSKKTVECGSGDGAARIYGNKVIWTSSDMTSGQSRLVMYDLSSKKTTNITTVSSDQSGTNSNSGSTSFGAYDVYGDNVVYINNSATSISDFSDITNIIGNIDANGGMVSGGVPNIYSISKGKITQIPEATQAASVAAGSNALVWDTPDGNITAYQFASSSSSSSSSSKVTKPVAAFKADKVSGKHPLAVTFTYTGTGGTPDSYTWNFGDKTSSVTVTAKTVKHTFSKAGTYTVSVTAKNKAGSSAATKSKYITVK